MVTAVTSSASLSSRTVAARQQTSSVDPNTTKNARTDSLELSAAATAKAAQAGGTSASSGTGASSLTYFDTFDSNEDGVVSLQEMIAGLAAQASAAKEASAAGDASAQEEVRPRVQNAAAYTQQQRVNMDAVGTTINMLA